MACVVNALKDIVGMLNIITASNVKMTTVMNVVLPVPECVPLANPHIIGTQNLELANFVMKERIQPLPINA